VRSPSGHLGIRSVRNSRSKPAASLALLLAVFLSACASLVVRDPVPETLVAEARVPGIDHARWWGDEVPADVAAEIRRNLRGITKLAESPPEKGRPVVNYLALSSGGDDGAFAAGVLVGWTRSGRRPRFEIVTGVSAGALIAPFAFLGPAYDKDLETIWTGKASADLITPQPLAVLLGGNALADSEPLAQLIAQYVNRRLLDAIAREYKRGRLLLVATTNLDAQRPVVWNMGEIALTSGLQAVTLFRQVLLASVSIPVAFPPVRIQVEAGGMVRDELHVDGGTTRKVFIAPLQISLRSLEPFYSAPPQHRFYIIANTKLAPEWKPAETDLFGIAQSSLAAINKSHAAGDLFRLYLLATREGADFNLALIPSTFSVRPNRPFDPGYMAALFEVGLNHAGSQWLKRPPELER
jgi:Patatin-like phospholipase